MDRPHLLSAYAAPLVHARRRLGARLVSRAFERAAYLGGKTKRAQPGHHGLEVKKDIPYLHSGLREHMLDVYKPQDTSSSPGGLPVVFYLHGGAFRSLSKDTHWIMGLAFARRGCVVAMPNYRLAPEHRFPAHLEDAAEALRYVVEHAHEWGGDPNKIILAGESAGANLVTALQLCISYEREEPYAKIVRSLKVDPLAVMGACGVFEVTNSKRFAEKYGGLHWFFDDRYFELEEGYPVWQDGKPVPHDLMNPLLLLEKEAPARQLPPFFLPVGALDHLKDDHARMERILLQRGVDVEAPVYPGEIHAFHAFVFTKNAKKCWQDHFEFLHKRGVSVKLTAPKV